MKFITLLFSILTLDSYGQVTKTIDSNSKNLPVYFLDSIRMDKNQLFFDPSKISEINVVKEIDTTTLNYGMIYIKSKKPKDFNFLTLPDIEKTYTKGISTSTLFMVDNEFLKDDISTYKIDSAYILNVEVLQSSEIEYLKYNLPTLTIFKIKLKTKENIAKANEIHIRGAEILKRF